MAKISILVTVYYNEKNLIPLYEDLKEKYISQTQDDYEIIMVDDCSGDNSWKVMKELADRDEHIVVIHLSRNFGAHAALLCAFTHATGDCAVVKACDLQEPTETMVEMIESWKHGNNVVLAVRTDRPEGFFSKGFANSYYWMVRTFALKNMPRGGFDIFLLDRKAIDTVVAMDEKNSAVTGEVLWSGFRTGLVPYIRQERKIGKSRWTLRKKVRLVMDTLYSFSTVPITIVSVTGGVSVTAAVIWAISVLIGKLRGKVPVSGWTSLFIFQLFSFGVIMFTLGIIGGYLWRTYDAARNRPVFIVEEKYGGGFRPE